MSRNYHLNKTHVYVHGEESPYKKISIYAWGGTTILSQYIKLIIFHMNVKQEIIAPFDSENNYTQSSEN